MHWFEWRLGELYSLAYRVLQYRQLAEFEVAGSAEAAKQARDAFVSGLSQLVQDVSERPGVEACFAAHEGFVVASNGDFGGFDALAAMAQTCISAAERSSAMLSIGPLKQIVIIGDHRKLALFSIGEMSLGILSLSTTVLSESLR